MALLWYNLGMEDAMPQIVPIRDLKNTANISALCHESDEPIFITKNGYGDMVIMSMETFEKNAFFSHLYDALDTAELDVKEVRLTDADDVVAELKSKYGLQSKLNR